MMLSRYVDLHVISILSCHEKLLRHSVKLAAECRYIFSQLVMTINMVGCDNYMLTRPYVNSRSRKGRRKSHGNRKNMFYLSINNMIISKYNIKTKT